MQGLSFSDLFCTDDVTKSLTSHTLVNSCVFKPVFSAHSLLVHLCLLCSCACPPVLVCPLCSHFENKPEAVESSFVFLFSFLSDFPLLVLCCLHFGFWISTHHQCSLVFVLHLGQFLKVLACKNHRKMYYLSIISVCKNYFPFGSATRADKAKPQ